MYQHNSNQLAAIQNFSRTNNYEDHAKRQINETKIDNKFQGHQRGCTRCPNLGPWKRGKKFQRSSFPTVKKRAYTNNHFGSINDPKMILEPRLLASQQNDERFPCSPP